MSTGFVFAGQRSQFAGMFSSFETFNEIRTIFDKASFILDFDLWEITQSDQVNQTINTQPILLTAEYALYRTMNMPVGVMAGHSLGEIIALTCAGAIDFETALRIVQLRGQLMQSLTVEGCMGMIHGLTYDRVLLLSKQYDVDISSVNTDLRISVSGEKRKVFNIIDEAMLTGALWTDVWFDSKPFHSRFMTPIAEQFKQLIDAVDITMPRCPVISNVSGQVYTSVEEIRTDLVLHLTNTVQWCDSIKLMKSMGVTEFVEIGPKPMLVNLISQILPDAKVFTIHDADSLQVFKDKY